MIKSFTVTNFKGDSIKMELGKPGNTGFLLIYASGLDPAKANIGTSEIATIDGSIYNFSRLNQRNIVLNILFIKQKDKSIEDVRLDTYRYFPIKQKIELVIETENRIVKTIGYVESNEINVFSKQEGTQISIICPSPYFYSTKDSDKPIVFSGVNPLFEFPFENDSLYDSKLIFGELTVTPIQELFYTGDTATGINIFIHAYDLVEDLEIINITTSESLKIDTDFVEMITGDKILEGDDIYINTKRGEKSIILIRGHQQFNILNCLGKGAKWINLVNGNNLLGISTKENELSKISVEITYDVIYEGV